MKALLAALFTVALATPAVAADGALAHCASGDAVCVGQVVLDAVARLPTTPAQPVIKTCSCVAHDTNFDLKLTIFNPSTDKVTTLPLLDSVFSLDACQGRMTDFAQCRP